MDYENRILSFINENFLLGDEAEIPSNQSLLGSGVIDSTGILELIVFIEKAFGIQITDAEMVPSNLDTISQIADFVRCKQARNEDAATEIFSPGCAE